jgi:hypothetical protein
MRRLPILELVMVSIVAVAAVLVLRARGRAEVLVENEWTCFWMTNRLDRSAPLPPGLRRVEGTRAWRHGGYLYAAYVPGEDGPVLADLEEVLAGEGPYLALAWPEAIETTGRRAFLMRSPGFVLQTENDDRSLSGLPEPPCPWPEIVPPPGPVLDPERGAPRGWKFRHRRKQRPRLLELGLRYRDGTKKKRGD